MAGGFTDLFDSDSHHYLNLGFSSNAPLEIGIECMFIGTSSDFDSDFDFDLVMVLENTFITT